MADRRISDEPVTGTVDDFNGTTFALVDGRQGSKKLPMDLFATSGEVNSIASQVASKYTLPGDGIPKTDLAQSVASVIDNAVQGISVNGTTYDRDPNTGKVNVTISASDVGTYTAQQIDNKLGSKEAGNNKVDAIAGPYEQTDPTFPTCYAVAQYAEASENRVSEVTPDNAESTDKYPSVRAMVSYTNQAIATNSANFLGSVQESDLPPHTSSTTGIANALDEYDWAEPPSKNDYCFVIVDNGDAQEYWRYKYTDSGTDSGWVYEYALDNSTIDTSAYDEHVGDVGEGGAYNYHITESERNLISTALQSVPAASSTVIGGIKANEITSTSGYHAQVQVHGSTKFAYANTCVPTPKYDDSGKVCVAGSDNRAEWKTMPTNTKTNAGFVSAPGTNTTKFSVWKLSATNEPSWRNESVISVNSAGQQIDTQLKICFGSIGNSTGVLYIY